MRYIFLIPWKVPQQSSLFKYIEDFQSRVAKMCTITVVQPQSNLSPSEIPLFYAKEIKKISVEAPLCFALDENGKNISSQLFSKQLAQYESRGEKVIVFCLGGAYGLPKELKSMGRLELFSLSAMTFPHELALAILFEQIYRAKCILSNHPYHHGEPSSLAKELQNKK